MRSYRRREVLRLLTLLSGGVALDRILDIPVRADEEPTAAVYRKIADEVKHSLDRHILSEWFPRAVDKAHGGFLQNFNADWSFAGDTDRAIVYQSRLTWVASEVAIRFPERRTEFRDYIQHGVRCLTTSFLDATEGGMFWMVDAVHGKPVGDGEKHAYGIAFSIYALANAYRATRDADTLALAKRTFAWLDDHAHDSMNGGYFEALSRAGKPIRIGERSGNDFIGTQYGQKSMNTHIHLLEAFTALHGVWPDRTVQRRLNEVFLLVRDRIAAPDGYLHMFFLPEWKPVSHEDSYGHDIETAFLLEEAAHALKQEKDTKTSTVSRRLTDHTLKYGWDTAEGGFFDSGPVNNPAMNRAKIWWTQAEGWNALLQTHARFGKETPTYWTYFLRQWHWIKTRQIDSVYGGWFATAPAKKEPGQEGRPLFLQKSNMWTDPYHQGRAAMNVIATLDRLAGKQGAG